MGLSNAGQKPFIVDLTTWPKGNFPNGTPIDGLFTLSGNVKTAYTATYSADQSKSWESNGEMFVWQPALIIDADADTHAATGAKKPWTICDAAKHMRQVAMAAIASVMILATPNATQAGSIDNDGYEKWYKEYQESVRRCGPEAEKKAINDARYIILAKLNKYLPNDFGEYEVILSLRGDIPVGSFIRDHAVHPPKDYPRIRIDPEPEYQAEIGRVLYYFGKTYEKDNTHYIVHPTPCMGRRKFYPENTGVSDVAKFVQKVIHPKIKN